MRYPVAATEADERHCETRVGVEYTAARCRDDSWRADDRMGIVRQTDRIEAVGHCRARRHHRRRKRQRHHRQAAIDIADGIVRRIKRAADCRAHRNCIRRACQVGGRRRAEAGQSHRPDALAVSVIRSR